jgi:hypothetical protein
MVGAHWISPQNPCMTAAPSGPAHIARHADVDAVTRDAECHR